VVDQLPTPPMPSVIPGCMCDASYCNSSWYGYYVLKWGVLPFGLTRCLLKRPGPASPAHKIPTSYVTSHSKLAVSLTAFANFGRTQECALLGQGSPASPPNFTFLQSAAHEFITTQTHFGNQYLSVRLMFPQKDFAWPHQLAKCELLMASRSEIGD
jgi:hypothetical protein